MAYCRNVSGPSGVRNFYDKGVLSQTSTFTYPFSMTECVYTSVSNNPKGNNLFYMGRFSNSGSKINGTNGSTLTTYYEFVDAPTPLYNFNAVGVEEPLPNDLASRLFAQANPYRANILVPAFLAELKDLPKMLYDLGRLKLNKKPLYHSASQMAQDWVSYNFGWAPLIGDLVKLADFHLQTQKREKDFDKLYSGSGLARRIALESNQVRVINQAITLPQPWNESIPVRGPITRDIWGLVRYKPALTSDKTPMARPSPKQLRRILAGLNADGMTASAWELVPWSWFIDYFYDVGSFLQANAGKRYLTIERACIMIHTRIEYTHESKVKADAFGRRLTLSPGRAYKESKRRQIVFPPALPQAHLPVLSGKQLSILGSLAFMRSNNLKR